MPIAISIVTPALDEATNLPLRAREIARQDGPHEWIVADGGSRDATIAVAFAAGARVVSGARGRGPQLDAGAARADGDALLFLHADTMLPDGALAAIRESLADPTIVGGNFSLRFDEPSVAGRLFELVYSLQQRLLGIYFGDSAIFVRRDVFARLGGFGTQPIMEDYAFARKLGRAGRVRKLRLTVTTSARRYRGKPLRTAALWIAIVALYHLGVPTERLRTLYVPHREPSASQAKTRSLDAAKRPPAARR